jgi:hypothetical protein
MVVYSLMCYPELQQPFYHSNDWFLITKVVLKRMYDLGWCKSEIKRLRNQSLSFNTVHFLSYVLKEPKPQDHSHCEDNFCRLTQIDLKNYKTKHTSDTCPCLDVPSTAEAAKFILKTSESYPVLRLEAQENSNESKIVVEKYSAGMQYVAISHVRSFYPKATDFDISY